jgi:DNA-binding winged helix-turn-helix (wHTH) protein/tetratricopeptide (TPR) repeat protein
MGSGPVTVELGTHRFAGFELDENARELRFDGQPVDVQRRVFDLLAHLVRHDGEAVSRQDLLDVVWRDVAVEDGSITRAIRLVRGLLSMDPSTADALETIRGHGYRIRLPSGAHPSVETPTPRVNAPRPDPSFYGRREEMLALHRCIEQSMQDLPQLALVSGEAGIGKTSLVDRALAIGDKRQRIGRGVCTEHYGVGEPFLPMLQALGEALDAGSRPLVWEGAFSVHQLTNRIVAAIETHPIVLIIEDVHWSDASTLDALSHLLSNVRQPGLAIIATWRSSDAGHHEALEAMRAELVAKGRASDIVLPRLRQGELSEWLEHDVSEPVPRQLVDRVADASGGNPLFVRALLDAPMVHEPRRPGPIGIAELSARLNSVPSGIEDLVAGRIDKLPETERLLLQCAAVVGTNPSVVRVAAAAGMPEAEIEDRMDALSARGDWFSPLSLERWPDDSLDSRVEFSHGLHVEALYASIPPASRARMHARIAERLINGFSNDIGRVSVELVHHLELSEKHELALRYRVEAARHAARLNALQEVLAHVDAGLERLDRFGGRDRVQIECDLKLALGLAQGPALGYADPRVSATYERANELAEQIGDENRALTAIWGLAACDLMKGELEPVTAVAEPLLARGQKADHRAQMLVAHDLLARTGLYAARFEECAHHAKEAMDLYDLELASGLASRVVQDFSVTAGGYGALSLWHLGQTAEAIRASNRAVAAADLTQHPYSRATAHCFAAILAELLQDETRLLRHVETAVRVSNDADLPLWRGVARVLGVSMRPPEDAIDEMSAGLGEMKGTGRLGGTYFLGLLAEKKREVGDLDGARELLDGAFALVEAIGEHHDEANLCLRRARLCEDPELGLSAYRNARQIAEQHGTRAIALRAVCGEAEILAETGGETSSVAVTLRTLSTEIDPSIQTVELRWAQRILERLPNAPVVQPHRRRHR